MHLRTDAPIGYCVAKLAALPKMASSDGEMFFGDTGRLHKMVYRIVQNWLGHYNAE